MKAHCDRVEYMFCFGHNIVIWAALGCRTIAELLVMGIWVTNAHTADRVMEAVTAERGNKKQYLS